MLKCMYLSQANNFTKILLFLSLILFMNGYVIHAQSATCDCDGTKPDTIFRLSNNKSFLLCGGHRGVLRMNGNLTFNDFVLNVCGTQQEIDFSEGALAYLVRVEKDTLFVEEIGRLPVGKEFQYEETIWQVERFYFQNNKLARTISPVPGIRKYSAAEIKTVISKYESSPQLSDKESSDLFYRLFVSTISGDVKANKYFFQFQDKFGPLDGVYAEEYNLLCKIMRLYSLH